MNGQILSNSYVVPDITKENFDFAVDVHGTDGVLKRVSCLPL